MKWNVFLLSIFTLLTGCTLELPITSLIKVDAEVGVLPVNKQLYGLSIEEINHAVEGGIYSELIQNRSFEDGVPPLNCPYNYMTNELTTPNGWHIPFIRPDSIPGWKAMNEGSYLYLDTKELINIKNRRSLYVGISSKRQFEKGGAYAEGFGGIPLKEGEKYNLNFLIKGTSMWAKPVEIALVDSVNTIISEVYKVTPLYEWKRFRHSFKATRTTAKAKLAFRADSSNGFWIDMVSLTPAKKWKDRENGLRPEVMEKIAALHPAFIRFPGGAFVEGYTAGTYPIWHETIGNLSERKSFWNVWAYGSSSGMGYHEYLQMCEDLEAEPLYVINSGVTNQKRRPRYENITLMDVQVKNALDAIAYANAPVDSVMGAMRAKNGHPKPFGLKYIEIGSENYGYEYTKRFLLFKKAINEVYPEVTVISSSAIKGKTRNDWADTHIYASDKYLRSHSDLYTKDGKRRRPMVFIGEFSRSGYDNKGSLQSALSEACFYIGVENSQDVVRRLAYAPILGNVNFPLNRYPALLYDGQQVVETPSYHLLKMFISHRGDEILKTSVQTYLKPQITSGYVGLFSFDNSYELVNVQLNGLSVTEGKVLRGGCKVNNGRLELKANRWNHILLGDSTTTNYTVFAEMERTKGSDAIEFRLRDNGLEGELQDYIGMSIGEGTCELYHQSGAVREQLQPSVPLVIKNKQTYRVLFSCENETIRCYVDDVLLHEVNLSVIPSLLSVATIDRVNKKLYLKVVNTTHHEEKTEFDFSGISVGNSVEIVELSGNPEDKNTFSLPDKIVPQTKKYDFSLGAAKVYNFPPNSISVLKFKID